jgi:hypothetical protein
MYFSVVTIRRGLDWMIGFIETLYTPLGTTGNYSVIADLHTLQFTVTQTHTPVFSVFTSHILATDSYQSYCNCSTHTSSLHSLIPFLPLFCQLPTPELNSILILAASDPRYIALGRPPQKTSLPLLLYVDSLLQGCVY